MRPSLWAWATVLAWATQAVVIRSVVKTAGPSDVFVLMGAIAATAAAAVLAIRVVLHHPLWSMTQTETWLLGGAEIVGIAGLASFYVAVKEAGLARAASISAFYPAIGVVLAWVLLREPPSPLQMLGVVLAGVGVALVEAGSK